jgi:hypothetical protein
MVASGKRRNLDPIFRLDEILDLDSAVGDGAVDDLTALACGEKK